MLPIYSDLSIFGQLELSKATTVSSVGAVNNLANSNTSILRVTSASAITLSGLVAPTSNKVLYIIHQGASTLTILNNSMLSSASNRILTPNLDSIEMVSGQIATLLYDFAGSTWIITSLSSAVGGGGGNNGLVYSPDKLSGDLLTGEYNNFAELIQDIQELPIKNIYFNSTNSIVLDIDDFLFGGNYNLEKYNLIGRTESSVSEVSVQITAGAPTDISGNNGRLFNRVENIFLRFQENLTVNFNHIIELVDSRFFVSNGKSLTANDTGQAFVIELKNSRIQKASPSASEILTGDFIVSIRSYYGRCRLDDEIFYGISSLTHVEYGAFDTESGRTYPIIGNQPAGSSLIPIIFNYKTIDQIEGGAGGGSSFEVSQVNTFTKGQPIYFDGVDWQLADTSEIGKVGVAVVSTTGDPFTASLSGTIELDGAEITALIGSATFTPGTTYYVSNTPGLLTSLSPAISNPILKAISTTKALIQPGFVASSNGVGESFVEDSFTIVTPTDNLTLSSSPLGKAYVWVTLDGFSEEPDAYTIANNVITFTYTIPESIKVVVKYVKAFKLDTRNNIIPFYEQVTGSPKSDFNLPVQPENSNYVLVWVDSVFQFSSYTLSGNVLTFDTPIDVASEVVVRIIQAVNFDIDVNNYITRKVVDIANDGDVLISTVFGDNISAEYRIKLQDNPRIFCHAWLNSNVDADFFTISSDVTNTFGTASKLNIDYNTNSIRIQNRTGSSRSVVIVREL